jgi:hypothetical protein
VTLAYERRDLDPPSSRWNPYWLAAAAVGLSVLLTPLFCYDFDVYGCWLTWARASGGTRPWAIYAAHLQYPCNYPPALLYLWTATEAVCRAVPWFRHRLPVLELVKLPNILAWAAGVAVCQRGLRRAWGDGPARAAAAAYALSLPLLFDAAIWGQYDAILCLAMVIAIVAMVDGRPALAGAAAGLAVGIKFQAIVALPAIGVYAVRRFGVARTAGAVVAGVGVLAAVSVPFAIAGQGRPMLAAYTGAVDYYPKLTVNAGNVWQPLRLVNLYARHLPQDWAESDRVRRFGVTAKQAGLAMFALYAAGMMWGLWRRPDGATLARAAGLTAFGFFMLPTQMHERYLVPAAVLLALPVGFADRNGRPSNRWLYVGLSVAAAAHLAAQQLHESIAPHRRMQGWHRAAYEGPLAMLTVLDVAVFAWATVRYVRDVWGEPRDGADGRALAS